MIDMTRKLYLPVASAYTKELADTISAKKACGIADGGFEGEQLKKVSSLTTCIYNKLSALEKVVSDAKNVEGASEVAMFYKDSVIPAMNELRANVDEMEGLVPASKWPVPSYGEMLFSVR